MQRPSHPGVAIDQDDDWDEVVEADGEDAHCLLGDRVGVEELLTLTVLDLGCECRRHDVVDDTQSPDTAHTYQSLSSGERQLV